MNAPLRDLPYMGDNPPVYGWSISSRAKLVHRKLRHGWSDACGYGGGKNWRVTTSKRDIPEKLKPCQYCLPGGLL